MKKAINVTGYIILILGALSMLLPFLWMLCISLMSDSQIFVYPPQFIPNPLIIDNYKNIFANLPITQFFINSLFVAIMTTFFQILFSTMAGYAFARSKLKHINLIFFIFLLTMMIPPQVNIVPLFFIMRELGWIDTYQALILPGIFGGFGIFLMRQWFLGLSTEIEDAAKIDGCNFAQIFSHIALPLSAPAIVTLALFTFITTWNSFLWPLIVTNSTKITTLPVAIAQFKSSFRETINWGDLMACSVILTLPVILIFILGKKYFIQDILQGGIKE